MKNNIGTGFGVANNPGTKISYRKITNNDYLVDDSNSKYYNKWVNINEVKKDWKSAEYLISEPIAYKYGVVTILKLYLIKVLQYSCIATKVLIQQDI